MLESFEEIIKNNDHQKIINLPSPDFDKYKVIAAIHLEKFEEALSFAAKNSFELAYIYYRLKNYKKSLKILRKLEGKNVEVLKSQCLYYLGYFSEAYKILKPLGDTDEYAVNLMAIISMNHLSSRHPVAPSIFSVSDEERIEYNEKPKFLDSECYIESEFNRVYKYLEDQDEYLSILQKMSEIHKGDNKCFKKQIANLTLDQTSSYLFSKKEQEIFNYNLGITDNISNPIFFQKNFLNNKEISDYKIFKDVQNNFEEYFKGSKKFEPISNRTRILKAFIIAKRNMTEERKLAIKKTIINCKESFAKKILQLFSSDVSEEQFKKEALKILLKKY